MYVACTYVNSGVPYLTGQEHFEPPVELGLDGLAGDEGVPQGLDVLQLGRGHLAGEHPELLQEWYRVTKQLDPKVVLTSKQSLHFSLWTQY